VSAPEVVGWVVIWAALGAAALALLWHIGRYANRALGRVVNLIPVGGPRRRALTAAMIACARRAVVVHLPGDTVLIVVTGHDWTQRDDIEAAIRDVIGSGVRLTRRTKTESEDR
jgi:hypothetical protein